MQLWQGFCSIQQSLCSRGKGSVKAYFLWRCCGVESFKIQKFSKTDSDIVSFLYHAGERKIQTTFGCKNAINTPTIYGHAGWGFTLSECPTCKQDAAIVFAIELAKRNDRTAALRGSGCRQRHQPRCCDSSQGRSGIRVVLDWSLRMRTASGPRSWLEPEIQFGPEALSPQSGSLWHGAWARAWQSLWPWPWLTRRLDSDQRSGSKSAASGWQWLRVKAGNRLSLESEPLACPATVTLTICLCTKWYTEISWNILRYLVYFQHI